MGAVQALQQSQRVVMMALLPDMKDGGGDCRSSCTIVFEGHKVCTFSHSDLVVTCGRL